MNNQTDSFAAIRALIVDDEPLARQRLRTLLKSQSGFTVIGEARNGAEALTAIRQLAPEVLFLDVQMPGMDGVGVVEALGEEALPLIVFVTAFDEYALRAFEANAVDYLLKPFSRARFEKTLARVRERLQNREGRQLQQQMRALLQELRPREKHAERLLIKNGKQEILLKTNDIDWIEAQDNYVCLHAGKEKYLMRESMSGLEKQLDARQFLRIHRSTMVNRDRIQKLEPWFGKDYRVTLTNGVELTMSRTYQQQVRLLLQQRL